ncbi:glycoside hydrolase family 3 protein [Ceratobasidium sp. AG-Ba]|nr:glycoside hydrolase family 3 protein [Ceratobasidium sp. AG-Ba]
MAAMSTLSVFSVCLIWAQFVLAQQPLYAQCGGIGWSGGTTCVSGAVCTKLNDYYYQCLAGSAATTTTSKTTSIPVTVTTTMSPTTSVVPTTTPASTSVTSAIGSTPTGAWASAISKAKAAVAKLSVSEKVSLGTGVQWQKGHCVGNTPAISSINFPGLCLQDAPVGVRYADKVSVFPAGINAAATFNRDLIQQRGAAMGAEFRGKGVHVALSPAMNIARVPAAGRNWEGFGGDPYLSGEAAYASIVGIQSQGVQACAKHYLNNEQEHFRETSSSNVDDREILLNFFSRTQHEIYLPPFLKSVQAGVASFMCSYNQINGTYACENSGVLNKLLKTELGFQGYVMSDWWATHSGAPAVNAGLDMTMPGDTTINSGQTYFGQNLVNAVGSQVSQSRLDDMATRILAAWYLLGQDSDYPAVNFDSWNVNGFGSHVDVQGNHKTLIRQIGAASTVLLKNKNAALPLSKPATIGVIGNDAGPNSKGINGCSDRSCNDGILGMGWGSGTAEYPYLVNQTQPGAKTLPCFISADSGEGYITVEGNAGMAQWRRLVAAVAAVNKNTIVVVHSVGPIIMESWIDHANVTASASDYSTSIITNGNGIVQIPYNEGLKVDYRAFDANGITPRFEFGFGLSYTTFTYSICSLSSWYQDPWVKVSFTLKNTGSIAGTEIPQLYISPPSSSGEPPNALKNFDSVSLAAGASTTVSMTLSRYDLSYWNAGAQQWSLIPGTTGIWVGPSSRSKKLTGFEKERRSSQNTTPEPTQQKDRLEQHSVASIRATNGSGSAKPPNRPSSLLNPKRTVPAQNQPAEPVRGEPEAPPKSSLISAPTQSASSQAAPSRVVMAEAVTPSVASPKSKGKAREEIASTDQEIAMNDQNDTVDQPVSEDNEGHSPTLNADSLPIAFEGVTKLQHELHCAMLLYYQATQGLPMTLPDSLPSK